MTYEVRSLSSGDRVSSFHDNERDAVRALREAARTYGEAVVIPVGGTPILVERRDGEAVGR